MSQGTPGFESLTFRQEPSNQAPLRALFCFAANERYKTTGDRAGLPDSKQLPTESAPFLDASRIPKIYMRGRSRVDRLLPGGHQHNNVMKG